MPTIRVHMLAFGKPNEVREVDVPDDQNKENLLDAVFHYGQNDFQNKPHPSVSSGDVIELDGKFIMVCRIGFRTLTDAELKEYREMERRDRQFSDFLDAKDD